MTQAVASMGTVESAEAALRRALAQGDAVVGTVPPILRHLLANDDGGLFGDDVIARVRGMADDVARQLLAALAPPVRGDAPAAPSEEDDAALAEVVDCLYGSPAFLGHVHALALEWQLAERLQGQLALDPVLSPLMQALVAASEPNTAALAMNALAAQARFCQAQRRMQLPLAELPADLLHTALLVLRTIAGTSEEAQARAGEAEASLRAGYDEGRTRLGLLARLVTGMGGGVVAALSASHAGVAIFLTALGIGSGQDRDAAVLATSESQMARLTLSLRAAGVKADAIPHELLTLHGDFALPNGFDRIAPERAAAILAFADGRGG